MLSMAASLSIAPLIVWYDLQSWFWRYASEGKENWQLTHLLCNCGQLNLVLKKKFSGLWVDSMWRSMWEMSGAVSVQFLIGHLNRSVERLPGFLPVNAGSTQSPSTFSTGISSIISSSFSFSCSFFIFILIPFLLNSTSDSRHWLTENKKKYLIRLTF